MTCPADQQCIESFEKLIKMCTNICELDEETKIRLRRAGHIDDLTRDLVKLKEMMMNKTQVMYINI